MQYIMVCIYLSWSYIYIEPTICIIFMTYGYVFVHMIWYLYVMYDMPYYLYTGSLTWRDGAGEREREREREGDLYSTKHEFNQ